MKEFLVFFLIFLPIFVLAFEIPRVTEAETFEEFIMNIIDFFFTIALALVPLIIVLAGIFMVTSTGNPEQFEKGKKIIIYALIGLVIILISKGLIALIEQVL